MDKKTLGIVILIVGIILAVVSATLDIIGLGRQPGFGYWQILGTTVGVIAFVIGLVYTLRK